MGSSLTANRIKKFNITLVKVEKYLYKVQRSNTKNKIYFLIIIRNKTILFYN